MYTFLVTIGVIASVFLVVAILLQASKGQGLAGVAGGSSEIGSMFGTRRTADFLSKATWWLGSSLLAIAVIVNLFFLPGSTTSEQRESIIQGTNTEQYVPESPALPEALNTESGTATDNSGEENSEN